MAVGGSDRRLALARLVSRARRGGDETGVSRRGGGEDDRATCRAVRGASRHARTHLRIRNGDSARHGSSSRFRSLSLAFSSRSTSRRRVGLGRRRLVLQHCGLALILALALWHTAVTRRLLHDSYMAVTRHWVLALPLVAAPIVRRLAVAPLSVAKGHTRSAVTRRHRRGVGRVTRQWRCSRLRGIASTTDDRGAHHIHGGFLYLFADAILLRHAISCPPTSASIAQR